MSWSYSGDPSASQRDELRFKIGDTDPTNPELQDEELDYIITNISSSGTYNVLKGCMVALRAIVAKYKALCDEKVADVDVKWSQRFKEAKQALQLYTEEHSKAALTGAYAGGISVGDKRSQQNNPDRTIPKFTKDFGLNKRITAWGVPRERSHSFVE